MSETKRDMSVSLTWVTGENTPALTHYAIKSTRGYASLRLREKEPVEVLRSVSTSAHEHLRSEPLTV